jgi:hypothetical protein
VNNFLGRLRQKGGGRRIGSDGDLTAESQEDEWRNDSEINRRKQRKRSDSKEFTVLQAEPGDVG